jgi:hypothetical protein
MELKYAVRPDDADAFVRAVERAARHCPEVGVVLGPETVVNRLVISASEGMIVEERLVPIAVHFAIVTMPDLSNGWSIVGVRSEGLWEWYGNAYHDAELRERVRQWAPNWSECHACNKNIHRTQTIVIQRGDEFLQVGGQCVAQYVPENLQKFLNAMSVALAKVINLDEPAEDDGHAYGSWCPGWYERQLVFRVLHAMRNDTYIPSRDSWDQPNPLATWRLAKDEVARWMACGPTGDTYLAYAAKFPADPDASAEFREYCDQHQPDAQRILEQDWCKMKDIAYLAGAYRRWHTSKSAVVLDGTVPTGRTKITGTVVSIKRVDNDYGVCDKALIESTDKYRVYGTVPNNANWRAGDTVTFTATFSPKEKSFGFYSRPALPKT